MGAPLISDPLEISDAYFIDRFGNHPFGDVNKRVALATCLVFLNENGLLPDDPLDTDVWENLSLAPAAGLLSREEITATLRKLLCRNSGLRIFPHHRSWRRHPHRPLCRSA